MIIVSRKYVEENIEILNGEIALNNIEAFPLFRPKHSS